jgi:fatty acid desaturase
MQTTKIKDPQFRSSIKYGLSLALAFVFLPLYLIISLLIFSPWWLGIIVFLSLPFSGLFAWNYYIQYRRIMGGFRIRNLISKNDKRYAALKKSHSELIQLLAGLKNE